MLQRDKVVRRNLDVAMRAVDMICNHCVEISYAIIQAVNLIICLVLYKDVSIFSKTLCVFRCKGEYVFPIV